MGHIPIFNTSSLPSFPTVLYPVFNGAARPPLSPDLSICGYLWCTGRLQVPHLKDHSSVEGYTVVLQSLSKLL